jgi:LemA protein
MPFLIALVVVVVLLAIWAISVYNGLIKARNQVKEAWSDIDVQLKRRYDLIPNLINTVKGYAAHESQVFEKVTEARTAAMTAQASGNPAEVAKAENALSGTLKSLFAVSESYPELKANQNFLQMQRDLTDTEDKIQASRRFYNGNVRDFNTSLQVFPRNIVASMFGFKEQAFFELGSEAERANPEVKF